MNTKELQKLIKPGDDFDTPTNWKFRNFIEGDGKSLQIGDYTLKSVYRERDNELIVFVFKIFKTSIGESENDQLFRINGSYDSWNGTTWDGHDFYEVNKKEKVITVYE